MKRLVCLATTLTVLAFAAGAGLQETTSIKDVMGKLHKGAKAPLAKLKTALKSESPDWKEVQSLSKEFVTVGAALAKNDPPRGEKADFEKQANGYYEHVKELDAAAQAEDKAKTQAALKKIGDSCKGCHAAHKGA